MAWNAQQPSPYPGPQQYYKIDLRALTWGELWHSGGGCSVLLAYPIVAVCKLFRINMAVGKRFPREIGFEAVDPATHQANCDAVAPLILEFKALGFEHFTTFTVPEMPYNSIIFALMSPAENAYAAVYRVAAGGQTKTVCDVVSVLADGGALTSCTSKEAAALKGPAKFRKQAVPGATPTALWQAHQARLAEIAPAAGGVAGPVGQDHFIEHFRMSIRETADFQAARGVYVPVG